MTNTEDNNITIDQVTPSLQHFPERTYILCADGIIQCFEAFSYREKKLLWQFELPSIDAAQILMSDLYYGEYTGG